MFADKGPWNEYPGDEFGESAKQQILEEEKLAGGSEYEHLEGYPTPLPPPNPGMCVSGPDEIPVITPVLDPIGQANVTVSLTPGVQISQQVSLPTLPIGDETQPGLVQNLGTANFQPASQVSIPTPAQAVPTQEMTSAMNQMNLDD